MTEKPQRKRRSLRVGICQNDDCPCQDMVFQIREDGEQIAEVILDIGQALEFAEHICDLADELEDRLDRLKSAGHGQTRH